MAVLALLYAVMMMVIVEDVVMSSTVPFLVSPPMTFRLTLPFAMTGCVGRHLLRRRRFHDVGSNLTIPVFVGLPAVKQKMFVTVQNTFTMQNQVTAFILPCPLSCFADLKSHIEA